MKPPPHCYRCHQRHFKHQDCVFRPNGELLHPVPRYQPQNPTITIVRVILVKQWRNRIKYVRPRRFTPSPSTQPSAKP